MVRDRSWETSDCRRVLGVAPPLALHQFCIDIPAEKQQRTTAMTLSFFVNPTVIQHLADMRFLCAFTRSKLPLGHNNSYWRSL